MNDHERDKAVADAKRAAAERQKAADARASERESARLLVKAKVDSAMESVVKPEIQATLRSLAKQDVPSENGNGTDGLGNTILTLRLRTKPFPPALVFTAETAGPNPRMTVHEELGHSVKEPRRMEIEDPERAAVAKVIADFLMRAM